MYSVIRFLGISISQMNNLAESINMALPEFCEHVEPCVQCRTQFSFEVLDNSEWSEQHAEIIRVLKIIGPIIINSYNNYPNLEIHLDIAVYASDYLGRFITEMYSTPELLHLLSELKIAMIISIYNSKN